MGIHWPRLERQGSGSNQTVFNLLAQRRDIGSQRIQMLCVESPFKLNDLAVEFSPIVPRAGVKDEFRASRAVARSCITRAPDGMVGPQSKLAELGAEVSGVGFGAQNITLQRVLGDWLDTLYKHRALLAWLGYIPF